LKPPIPPPSEDVMPPIPPPTADFLPPLSLIYDINRLPHYPSERLPIASDPFNYHDVIRRAYILKGPFQPYVHEFKKRLIGGRDQIFKCVWF